MSLDDDIDLLTNVPTLALFEPDALRLLAFAAQGVHVDSGEVLFRRGAPSDGAYVVRTGSIALTAQADGAAFLAGTGTLIDELAMFVEVDRDADAVAREPSEVIYLSRELVRRVLREFPSSAVAVRDGVARRLSELTRELADVGDRLQRLG
ncbi:Crp/Fnr family transcriptional regulator [Chelatococcus reniformis]|uniref:Cyclic nucleotide-binding protein n=1 Tax=Chelatococcus reniformis TaxID=1494448 RepID=A0A916TXS6_9HYPH|nr:Crp/Fnr family transcriptional regulator [Chelatococcus reniformis]GGC51502.1 cyclic nucleotide-binding protein [Chelatococcus reniformis]